MLVRIYTTLWAAVAAIALVLLLSGNFTMLAAVAFGFVAFGMVFMGMMSVLPSTVVHPARPVQLTVMMKQPQLANGSRSVLERLRAFKAAWTDSDGVEMRKPTFR